MYNSGGTEPRALAVADFNGDGKLDIAVANYGSNNVGVLLNAGNGTFPATATTYGTNGSGPRAWRPATSTATASPTWSWPTTPATPSGVC